jgi:hypothetical protein
MINLTIQASHTAPSTLTNHYHHDLDYNRHFVVGNAFQQLGKG